MTSIQSIVIRKKLTHLDSKLAGNIEEHSDPLPGDAMLKNVICHLLKSVPIEVRATSHSVYRTAAETK